MTAHSHHPIALPEYWTPTEALAVFEMLDLLRDHLWDRYGCDIQHALRDQIGDGRDPRQYDLPFDTDPF